MTADVALAFDSGDAEIGREVEDALAAAGFSVTRWHDSFDPVPGRLAVLLVTRRWSRSTALNDFVDAAADAGQRVLLAWWHEDAPSDFLSESAAGDEIFYACFLPRPQRAAGLVERLRDELAGG
jgi:hypothetical protein